MRGSGRANLHSLQMYSACPLPLACMSERKYASAPAFPTVQKCFDMDASHVGLLGCAPLSAGASAPLPAKIAVPSLSPAPRVSAADHASEGSRPGVGTILVLISPWEAERADDW